MNIMTKTPSNSPLMGRIDTLVHEICPEGVEKVKIKDAFTRLKGTPITAGVMKDIEDNEGDVIIFAGGKTIIKANEKDIPNANITNVPSVIVQSRGVIDVQYCDTPCTFKNEMWAYTADNSISVKYLFYYLRENIEVLRRKGAEHGSMPQISLSATENYEIPLPPLSIQQEIVSVLDSFTTLIDRMKQEVEKRKKQMEYYREKLLTFEDGIKMFSFGNSFQLKARIGWQGLTKKEYKIDGKYKLVTGTDFTENHTIDFTKCVYVDKERYDQDENIQLKDGDVLITKDGTLGKVAYIEKLEYPTTLNGGVFVVRDLTGQILQTFTKHYLCSQHFKLWMEMNHTSGSIQHLTQKLLVNFMIPVPPLSKQREIVSTLDKFESYISKLEKMIALRQKQYEYYREQLLTFE